MQESSEAPNYSIKGNSHRCAASVPLSQALGATSATGQSERRVRNWLVSLTLRGFECTAEQAQELLGLPADHVGTRGLTTKPGRTPLKRSFVQYSVEFPTPPLVSDMVPAILARTGGVDRLCAVRDTINPEFLEIDLTLPVKHSLEQVGGFISHESIADLNRLRATLSFGILGASD